MPGFVFLLLALTDPAPVLIMTPCAPSETIRATVEEVVTAGDAWQARCVQVSGMTTGATLRTAGADGVSIGLEYQRELGIGLPANAEVAVTLIGRVDRCTRRQRAADDEMRESGDIIFLAGACHRRGGSVLIASEGRRDP